MGWSVRRPFATARDLYSANALLLSSMCAVNILQHQRSLVRTALPRRRRQAARILGSGSGRDLEQSGTGDNPLYHPVLQCTPLLVRFTVLHRRIVGPPLPTRTATPFGHREHAGSGEGQPRPRTRCITPRWCVLCPYKRTAAAPPARNRVRPIAPGKIALDTGGPENNRPCATTGPERARRMAWETT